MNKRGQSLVRDRMKQFLIRNRRGLSEVVTTLIIILLVLVAIGTVWFVINNILSEGSEQIGLEQFSVDVNFLRASINGNDVTLTVKRATGPGNLSGMKFILSDGSNSEEFTETGGLSELQEKTFIVTLTSLNSSNLRTASVAPVYTRNAEDVLGAITATYTCGGGSSGGNGGNGGNGNGGNGGNGGGGCVPACGVGEICNNGMCVPEGCTDSRTDAQVCSDKGAVCGTVQNICGNFVDCDAAIGGCTALEQCISNTCQPLTSISGTVYSVWPTGIAIYFDSSDLPTDNVYSGYYVRFLPPSQESECLLVENYEIPQPPQTKVMVKLQATQTSIAAGESVQLWPTFASCSA